MKKIYIFTAVLALLTVSLNAQLKAIKKAIEPTATERVEIAPDGYFRMGPSRASTNPVTPPYSNSFDSDDEWNWWEAINANNDSYTWSLSSNSARYHWNSGESADDWLVTAPLNLKAGKTYKFYIDTKAESSYYSERLEVKMANANTATALSSGTTIIGSTNVDFTTYQTLSNENVTVSADGTYYIGIHAISDANMYYLYVDNFVIDAEITDPTITSSQESISLTCAPGSSATQTVTVTGLNLTDDNITATLNDANGVFSVSPNSLGTTGGDLTITYSPTAVGNHTATITLTSAGAQDVVINVTGTCIAGTTYELVTDPSTQLIDGKKYILVHDSYAMGALSGTSSLAASVTITNNGDGTVTVPGTASAMVLTLHDYSNSFNANYKYTFTRDDGAYLMALGGNTNATYLTTNTSPIDNASWRTVADVKSTGGYGIQCYRTTTRAIAHQTSGDRFGNYATSNITANSTAYYYALLYVEKEEEAEPVHDLAIALSEPESVVAGETATITATVTNNGNQTETGYTVTISANGTTISTQTVNEALAPGATATVTAQYSTTAAQGGTIVNIAANVACTDDADATNDDTTASLQVTAQVQDLAIALSAPASVVGGNTAEITATVTNTGNQPMSGYTVTISDGSTTILTQTVNDQLAAGASATYTAQYTTTAAQVGSTVTFTANVTSTGDADATNNDATASMNIISMPPPENVVATANNDNQSATVTWNAPSNLPTEIGPYTEDFENGTNGWTFIDADGDGYNWTHITYVQGETDARFEPHSGTGYMNSASFINNVGVVYPDNWLISPEINLGGTVTLWAKGTHSSDFAENFGLYVYEGSYNGGTSGFVQVGSDVTTTYGWLQYTFDLSQYSGTGRIAIRHYECSDKFNLEIDDISYQTTITIQPESYKIYLDGQLVGSVDADDPLTYDFSNVAPGDHTASVSAVYPGNIESAQVPATFTIVPKTAMPEINVTPGDDAYTITATGAGTVHMYVDGQEVTQPYEAQRQMNDYTIIVTATAQENGSLISETATREVTIPGLYSSGEWSLMTGTYSGNQPLSLIDSISRKPIMFCDSLAAMTFDNRHPDHYNYQITEVGNEMTSNMVEIPVHKTYSTMYGLFTKEEVDGDTKRTLTANSPNVALTFDTKNADEMYYYALQRSAINTAYPNTDPLKAISKLQESNDKFSEQYDNGVLPKYDDEPAGLVKRVDRYFTDAIGEPGDFETYVPVIWTFGSRTNRRPGQANINNSYGSDIKRNTLGDVNIEIYVEKSNYQATNQSGETVYPGVWPYQGTPYTVFTPKLTITGTPPAKYVANDGDTIVYVPYMFRAWCLYEHPHDFARNSETELLEDRGEIPAADLPLLLGTVYTDQDTCTIGGLWKYGMDRLPWAFGAPVSTQPQDLTFAVRFYYKAIVKDSGKPLFRAANRDGETEFAEEYLVVETSDNPDQIPTGLDELMNAGRVPVSTTYVNSVGMQSDRPFDGLNIVITRYSDGTTSTVKVMK